MTPAQLANEFEAAIRYARQHIGETGEGLLAASLENPHVGPIFADYLEEHSLHHDAPSLEFLRSGRPFSVKQHDETGKVIARPLEYTIDDIKRIAADKKHPYFKQTGFFGSRYSPRTHNGPGGLYFVQSDKPGFPEITGDYSRPWSVHRFDPVEGLFHSHVTRDGNEKNYDRNNIVEFYDPQHPLASSRDAHALAAHLAQHGLPPGVES